MEALNTVAEFAYENPLATLVAAGAGYLYILIHVLFLFNAFLFDSSHLNLRAVSAMMTSDPRQRPSASAPKKDQPKPKKGHGKIPLAHVIPLRSCIHFVRSYYSEQGLF